ncbi:hypothetical protein QOT17_000064 [Balamuthia mandrillaris]
MDIIREWKKTEKGNIFIFPLLDVFVLVSGVQSQTICFGHYGENGDGEILLEESLKWCCLDCNCRDLADEIPCVQPTCDTPEIIELASNEQFEFYWDLSQEPSYLPSFANMSLVAKNIMLEHQEIGIISNAPPQKIYTPSFKPFKP